MLKLTSQELGSIDRMRAALNAEIAGDAGEARGVWLSWRAGLDELCAEPCAECERLESVEDERYANFRAELRAEMGLLRDAHAPECQTARETSAA